MATAFQHPHSYKLGPGPLGTSEQEDARRQKFKQELQNDMQQFLAQQAQENPRLRRLRRRQSEVTTSIIGGHDRGRDFGDRDSQARAHVPQETNHQTARTRDDPRDFGMP